MAYPRALRPNYALDQVNVFALDLGTPKLADTDWLVVDRAMANATFTLAHTNSGDTGNAAARNVTVKATQAGGQDDTFGKVTITGTDVNGDVISEEIVPVNGSTVAGLKAFKTVTSVVQSGWTAGGTADRIEVGFGGLVGIPAMAGGRTGYWVSKLHEGDAKAITGYVGTAVQAPTIVADDTVPGTTFDLSAGTYNGSKQVFVLIAQ